MGMCIYLHDIQKFLVWRGSYCLALGYEDRNSLLNIIATVLGERFDSLCGMICFC